MSYFWGGLHKHFRFGKVDSSEAQLAKAAKRYAAA